LTLYSFSFGCALYKGKNDYMTEELVTLEIAKLLKEKGMFTDIEFPTQSIVQKWLRETKDLHIGI